MYNLNYEYRTADDRGRGSQSAPHPPPPFAWNVVAESDLRGQSGCSEAAPAGRGTVHRVERGLKRPESRGGGLG